MSVTGRKWQVSLRSKIPCPDLSGLQGASMDIRKGFVEGNYTDGK